MLETVLKHYLEGVKGHLEREIKNGLEKLRAGELTQDEYQRYLRMSFQMELEDLLGIKLDITGGEK